MSKIVKVPTAIQKLTANKIKRYFYLSELDMRKRSDGIAQMLLDHHGVEFDNDCMIIADNKAGKIRVFIFMGKKGVYELRYKLIDSGKMIPLTQEDGEVKTRLTDTCLDTWI